MKNKLTLLIDGNWLLMSRMSVLIKGFDKNNPDIAKQQTSNELKELMARSINVMLNRFKEIDNIVFISDGGSWRKQIPIPKSLEDTTYKGNRGQAIELDWDYIYNAFNDLFNQSKELGITCSRHYNCEGDDWVWYWSRRLNADGIHCLIWSSDNDLKQLVQVDQSTQAFTIWYNDKAGLWLPAEMDKPFDEFDFFMKADYISPVLESIKKKLKKYSFIDPNEIILNKILCGDSGDNIKAVVRYTKNNRTYNFAQKDFEKLVNDLEIKTIQDLRSSLNQIAHYICSMKKYKPYRFNENDVIEMLEYNTKLVWLHEEVLPNTAISSMVQDEYQLYDLSYIRDNFKILIGEDDEIKNLFDSINI